MHKNYPSNSIFNFKSKLNTSEKESNPSNTTSFFEKTYDLNEIDFDRPITLEESDTKKSRNNKNNSKAFNSLFSRKSSNSSQNLYNFNESKFSVEKGKDIEDNNNSKQKNSRNINKNIRRRQKTEDESPENSGKTMKSSISSFNIYKTGTKYKGISIKNDSSNTVIPLGPKNSFGTIRNAISPKRIPFEPKKNIFSLKNEISPKRIPFSPKKNDDAPINRIPPITSQKLFEKDFDISDMRDNSINKIPIFPKLSGSILKKDSSSKQLPFFSKLSESTMKKDYSTKQLPFYNKLTENTKNRDNSSKKLLSQSNITFKNKNYSSKILPFVTEKKNSSIKNKKNQKNITNLDENRTLQIEKQKNENIKYENATKEVENKEIVKKRRPNIPKYEKRLSSKNIKFKKKKEKEKEPEDKTVKLENYEKISRDRKNSIEPSRKKSSKHIKMGTEFTTYTFIKNCEALSTAGRDDDGLTKTNQDTYILEKNINGVLNFNIFGVLDGHGVNGHFASQFVKRYMISRIKNHPSIKNLDNPKEIYKKLIENRYEIIASIFMDADNQITKEKFNCEMSGTTCNIVIQLEEHIICANAGDSRSFLVYDETNTQNNLTNTKIYFLSYDCKPQIPNEKKRIESFGGVVLQDGDSSGPFRVWIKGEKYPGLAISRSIGDMDAKKVGVIPNPQIIEYTLGSHSKYMIICSDGIWEYISNEEAMVITNKYYLRNDPKGLCQDLTNISTSRWLKDDIAVDDITVVVVFF